VLLGVALWLCVLASGVHATIAGVLLALAVPARTRIDEDEFLARAEASLADFRAADEPGTTVLTNRGHQEALQALESAADAAQAPLQRMEHALHGFVAFSSCRSSRSPTRACRSAGRGRRARQSGRARHRARPRRRQAVGIFLASYAAVRAGAADLPAGVAWRHVHGAGWLGGIGFTMSLFVAGLAFTDPAALDVAKLGVLGASVMAGTVGYLLLRNARRGPGVATGLDVPPRRSHRGGARLTPARAGRVRDALAGG
jgi:NhaA family Na+:H+ antiporter